jgi:RimJ/RimL family protein N-acetyltransferase
MFEVLQDPAIHRYLDYPPPPSIAYLQSIYAKIERRTSPDGTEQWLNWAVFASPHCPVGYVQATVKEHGAWVAYVLSSEHWGRGYAPEATQAMLVHLTSAYSVQRFLATVETENRRSIRLLLRLGFHCSDEAGRASNDLSATELLFVRQLPSVERQSATSSG